MPAEEMTAKAESTQKRILTAFVSQTPALSVPYCETLIKMVPNETTDAGTNNDSVGCNNDALNVYGNR